MIDGPGRRLLKAIALGHFTVNVWTHRGWLRFRGKRSHVPAGECRRCAKCCEAPSVRANAAVWYLGSLRRLFLGWMKHVNGFELERADRRSRTFVFRCTHFEWETRRCDSYASRPGLCRDYPRALLDQPRPQLFPECGYRARPVNATALQAALDRQPLSPEQRRRLGRELDLQ